MTKRFNFRGILVYGEGCLNAGIVRTTRAQRHIHRRYTRASGGALLAGAPAPACHYASAEEGGGRLVRCLHRMVAHEEEAGDPTTGEKKEARSKHALPQTQLALTARNHLENFVTTCLSGKF